MEDVFSMKLEYEILGDIFYPKGGNGIYPHVLKLPVSFLHIGVDDILTY